MLSVIIPTSWFETAPNTAKPYRGLPMPISTLLLTILISCVGSSVPKPSLFATVLKNAKSPRLVSPSTANFSKRPNFLKLLLETPPPSAVALRTVAPWILYVESKLKSTCASAKIFLLPAYTNLELLVPEVQNRPFL